MPRPSVILETFMSDRYESIRQQLTRTPRKWLITGVAGFIGSNLLEALL